MKTNYIEVFFFIALFLHKKLLKVTSELYNIKVIVESQKGIHQNVLRYTERRGRSSAEDVEKIDRD